jgi:hypothetical protein
MMLFYYFAPWRGGVVPVQTKCMLRSRCTKEWQRKQKRQVSQPTCCSTAEVCGGRNFMDGRAIQCGILVIAEDGYAHAREFAL